MKRIVAALVVGASFFCWSSFSQAAHPAAFGSCAYLQFINVYDDRIGRSYAVGAQAWCGDSRYEWRVVVGCARTLGGYAYLTTKGPWTHSYWSVRQCPTFYPYANWANYERRLR